MPKVVLILTCIHMEKVGAETEFRKIIQCNTALFLSIQLEAFLCYAFIQFSLLKLYWKDLKVRKLQRAINVRINFWLMIFDVFLNMQKNKVYSEIICHNKAKFNCK